MTSHNSIIRGASTTITATTSAATASDTLATPLLPAAATPKAQAAATEAHTVEIVPEGENHAVRPVPPAPRPDRLGQVTTLGAHGARLVSYVAPPSAQLLEQLTASLDPTGAVRTLHGVSGAAQLAVNAVLTGRSGLASLRLPAMRDADLGADGNRALEDEQKIPNAENIVLTPALDDAQQPQNAFFLPYVNASLWRSRANTVLRGAATLANLPPVIESVDALAHLNINTRHARYLALMGHGVAAATLLVRTGQSAGMALRQGGVATDALDVLDALANEPAQPTNSQRDLFEFIQARASAAGRNARLATGFTIAAEVSLVVGYGFSDTTTDGVPAIGTGAFYFAIAGAALATVFQGLATWFTPPGLHSLGEMGEMRVLIRLRTLSTWNSLSLDQAALTHAAYRTLLTHLQLFRARAADAAAVQAEFNGAASPYGVMLDVRLRDIVKRDIEVCNSAVVANADSDLSAAEAVVQTTLNYLTFVAEEYVRDRALQIREAREALSPEPEPESNSDADVDLAQ